MSVHLPSNTSKGKRGLLVGSHQPVCHPHLPDFYKMMILIVLCTLLLTSAASATEYVLNIASMEQFKNGIHYSGEDSLSITIQDDVTMRSNGNAGIESTAPVMIKSPSGRTLTIIVDNNSDMLYGVKAPAISVESGRLEITVNGKNSPGKGNAFGMWAGKGDVLVSGGSVRTTVETTGHKNKGIYAADYIRITNGSVALSQQGGKNTFGLDGGDTTAGETDSGVLITGGTVTVDSAGGSERNIGIDSKYGRVSISGNPFVAISEDGSGSAQNYPYNPNITMMTGTGMVIFTAENGLYTLARDAILSRNTTLISGKTFVIPMGRTLGISEGTYLTKPADTTLLYGKGHGTFEYAKSIPDTSGAASYAGKEPTQHASVPLAGLLAGLGAAVLLRRKE